MEVFVQNSSIYCIFRLPSVTDRFNPNNQFPDPICYSNTLPPVLYDYVKAVVAAFNQEKALVGAFSVITNLRMELFEALILNLPRCWGG